LDSVGAAIVRMDYSAAQHCFITVGHAIAYAKPIPCYRVRKHRFHGESRPAKRPKRRGRGANPARLGSLRCAEMLCEIAVGPDYLRADLFNRKTVEETRDALAAITTEARKHGRSQILISVRASRPISQVEEFRVLEYFRELGGTPKHRIALTGDSDELRLSQQYFESVARRNGINVRSLPNEQAALDWLKDRRWTPDRRERQEPLGGKDRRRYWRRSLERIRPDSD
jgi:hypothetical protein